MENFTQEEILGSGRQGTVYKSIDKRTNTTVVMKIFNDSSDGRREIAIIKLLHQKSLYNMFYESFIDKDRYVLIMEYLGDYRVLQGFEVTEDIGELTVDMINNLRTIHDAGVIHRDIKPANIMIDPIKNKAKFIDFGLACIYDTGLETHCKSFVGTYNYIYPKMFSLKLSLLTTNEDLIHSDYYSLFSVIYYLVVGRTPNSYFIDYSYELSFRSIKDKLLEISPSNYAKIVNQNKVWLSFVDKYPYIKELSEWYLHPSR